MNIKTLFPKKQNHIPKWFIIDAKGQSLGRLASEISKLLRGIQYSYYTPGIDQGNYVVVLNVHKIKIIENKDIQEIFYRNSQRPGSLKAETLKRLKVRIPLRVLEKAVKGMLPKGILGRQYYRRLFLYTKQNINEFILNQQQVACNWIKINI